ncbi:thiamine phosphate synthase [Salinicoccus sp. CNSTN-B1]
MMDKNALELYFICGSSDTDEHLPAVVEKALDAGITLFQLREKGSRSLTGDELVETASEIKKLCDSYEVPFIINDDYELAEQIEADGVHLGQDDIGVQDLPPYFNDKIVGLSVGNAKELASSNLKKVSYIGTGPVYATPSKADAGKAITPKGLADMRRLIGDKPMVAIGGITPDNYMACLENGADGICVISAIANAPDIRDAVHRFL